MKKNKVITMDFEGTLVSFQWNLTKAVDEILTILSEKGIPRENFRNMNYATIYNLVQEKGEEWGFPDNYLGSLLDDVYESYDLDAAENQRETLIKEQPNIVLDKLTELPAALKYIGF